LKGNGNAAILLSQLLYWSRKTTDTEGWFYNTQEELQGQTGLGSDGQLSARQLLRKLGLLDEKRRGMPARIFYRLNLERVADLIVGHLDHPVGGHGRRQASGHGRNQVSVHGPRQVSLHGPSQPAGDAPQHVSGHSPPHNKDYQETSKDHSHTPSAEAASGRSVGVRSNFSLEECRRYAEDLYKTRQGITNPGGYATSIYRSGEADSLIARFLSVPGSEALDARMCPDCHGMGFWYPQGLERGVSKCKHQRLFLEGPERQSPIPTVLDRRPPSGGN
jgi:hypothetical protein